MRRTAFVSAVVGGVLTLGCVSGCARDGAVDPSASAPVSQLGAEFGACSETGAEYAEPRQFLAHDVERWVRVAKVDSATREADENLHTFPATVITQDGTSERVRIHNTFWPGVDWGLAHDATVWFGLGSKEYGDPSLVMTAMVVTPDDVFFPGDCQDVSMTEPLHDVLGARTHDVLASLPTTDPSKVEPLLGVEPTPTPSGPTILNPQDAPQELLDSLAQVTLHVRITSPLGKGETSPSLCTHITEGWGDCVMTDDSTVEGVDFSAYANTSGEVEVWLLDGNADVTQPIGYLGSITLPLVRSDTSPDKLASHTVDTVVDTSSLDLSSLPDTAVTTEANEGRVTFTVLK